MKPLKIACIGKEIVLINRLNRWDYKVILIGNVCTLTPRQYKRRAWNNECSYISIFGTDFIDVLDSSHRVLAHIVAERKYALSLELIYSVPHSRGHSANSSENNFSLCFLRVTEALPHLWKYLSTVVMSEENFMPSKNKKKKTNWNKDSIAKNSWSMVRERGNKDVCCRNGDTTRPILLVVFRTIRKYEELLLARHQSPLLESVIFYKTTNFLTALYERNSYFAFVCIHHANIWCLFLCKCWNSAYLSESLKCILLYDHLKFTENA